MSSSRIEEAYKKFLPQTETRLDRVFKQGNLTARRASYNTYLTQLTPAGIKRAFDAQPTIEQHAIKSDTATCANCQVRPATTLLRKGNAGPYHATCADCSHRVAESL
jgi:hypothetical protein